MNSPKNEIAVLGGGCFWCTEAIFSQLRGVQSVTSGYAGGETENPTYDQVCTGCTGHAEVIRIAYDPARISYRDLLEVFFALHDPTTTNRQGSDVGEQYRSLILTTSDAQRHTASRMIARLAAEKKFPDPIVTEVKPLGAFYPAESFQQNFYAHHAVQPYCQLVVEPKLTALREKFPRLISGGRRLP